MYLGRSPSNGWAPHLGVYSERRIDKVWFYIIIIAFDEGKRILTLSPGISFCIPCDRPFATSHSRGTRPPCWDKTNKENYHYKLCMYFVCLVPVRLLLPSVAVLHHMNG